MFKELTQKPKSFPCCTSVSFPLCLKYCFSSYLLKIPLLKNPVCSDWSTAHCVWQDFVTKRLSEQLKKQCCVLTATIVLLPRKHSFSSTWQYLKQPSSWSGCTKLQLMYNVTLWCNKVTSKVRGSVFCGSKELPWTWTLGFSTLS